MRRPTEQPTGAPVDPIDAILADALANDPLPDILAQAEAEDADLLRLLANTDPLAAVMEAARKDSTL